MAGNRACLRPGFAARAHYTPRAYVERLVVVTVMEPLRQEWAQVQATADRLKHDADELSERTEARHQAAKPNDRRELDAIRDARAEVRRIGARQSR